MVINKKLILILIFLFTSVAVAGPKFEKSLIPLEKSNDVDFIVELLTREPFAYKDVSPLLRNNEEVIKTFLKYAAQNKPEPTKISDKERKEIYLEIATNKKIELGLYEDRVYLMQGISDEWLKDKNFVLSFINYGHFTEINFPGVEPDDPNDSKAVSYYAMINAANFPEFYVYIKSRVFLGNNKDITMAMFKKYSDRYGVLRYLDRSAFSEDFFKKLVKNYKTYYTEQAIDHIYNYLVKDTDLSRNRKFALFSVHKYGFLLKYFPNFQDDREVVVASQTGIYKYDYCDYDGCYEVNIPLQYASEKLKDDKQVVLGFLKNDVKTLQYVSDRLKDNSELFDLALKKNMYYDLNGSEPEWSSERRRLPILFLASDRIKELYFDNEKVMEQYIVDNYKYVEHTSLKLKNNPTFIKNILSSCEKYQPDEKIECRNLIISSASEEIKKSYQ